MIILGIGGVLNESAAALLKNGALVGACEEKKLARQTRPGELPGEAIAMCLRAAQAAREQVDCVAIVRPLAAGPETAQHLALRERFPNSRIVLVDHHTAHAASAFYPSPFEEATVLTLDRAGDFRCGARWRASAGHLALEREQYYPDSLGDLYARVVELLGHAPGSDFHKVQWLSVAGGDRFEPLFREMLCRRDGEWPRIDRTFFDAGRLSHGGFSARFYERLGLADGAPVPASMAADVAAGLQRAMTAVVLEMAGSGRNLCLGGGLFLNALLVASIERSPNWENVFVQPAAGNAGAALGAVYHAWHNVYQRKERVSMGDFCLGPGFDAEEIKRVLENCKLRFRYLLTSGELTGAACAQLADNKIVAWMQGRTEFGPRALGNRSILASPLNPYSTENLNIYIKHREPYRKFAASVPTELASEYFETGPNARFLATVGRVRPAYRQRFESALLDGERIRVHTVSREDNPLFWNLLHAAGQSTGLPVLYNTSFNLFGDPLVCTPRDAVRSFYSSGVDALFVGHFLLEK